MLLKRFFTFATCLFLVSCGAEDSEKDKPLVVMVSPDNPPFEYKDTASGGEGVLGFDIDLINLIGQEMGKEIKIVEVDFPTIIPGIQSKRADMGISAIAATEERRKNVDFSEPYYEYTFAAVTPGDVTIESHHDLAHKKIGAQLGSSHEAKAQELALSLPGVKVVSLNKVPELILELKKGRSDVLLTSEAVAKKVVKVNPKLNFTLLDDLEGETPVIVFPKGSPHVEDVNQAIQNLKERGEIDTLSKKWFSE